MEYRSSRLYYVIFGALVTCAIAVISMLLTVSCGRGLQLPRHQDPGARIYTSFVKQLGNVTIGAAAGGNDIASATARDNNSGAIYVTGSTDGSLAEANAGNFDVFVAKFDSTGSHLWTTQLGNVTVGAAASGFDSAFAIALDSAGNVYLAGATPGSIGEANAGGDDVLVVKIDSSGAVQWTKQLGNVTVGAGASNSDTANTVAVDNSGNIYVAGQTFGNLGEVNGGSFDAFVSKLDSSGNLLWTTQFGSVTVGAGAAGGEAFSAATVDSSGNVYLTGYASDAFAEANAGMRDVIVAKLDTNGVPQWTRQYGNVSIGASASSEDFGYAIALDSSNNVVISGSTTGSLAEANAGNADAFISRLDNAGNIVWTRQLGNVTLGAAASGTDFPTGLALDASNNIYVSGNTDGSLGEANGGNEDLFAIKFDSAGTYQWIRQFGAATVGANASGADRHAGMAIDSDGCTYIGARTTGSLFETNAGSQDVALIKLKPDGSL